MASSSGSLALRAIAALLLFIGFYVLALAIAGGLLLAVYVMAVYGSRIPIKLMVIAVVTAGIILWSLLPQIDEFEPPGPRLSPQEHPRLFEVLAEVAEATGQSMPREVYLVPNVNAWVSSRGGVMGIGSRRIMGLGLPLMQQLSTAQMRAVLAHELGHYHGGDVALGPWLYQTRAAIGRTIEAFHQAESTFMHLPFEWYGLMFLRVTHGISRHQELQADALAARVVGPEPLCEGLLAVHRGALAHRAYMESEVLPILRAGFRPPIADGFRRFVNAELIRQSIEDGLEHELSEGKSDPLDTHPALRERLAAVKELPAGPGPSPGDDRPAVELLEDLDAVEKALVVHMRSALPDRDHQAIAWEQVGTSVYAKRSREAVRDHAKHLQGITVGTIPTSVKKLAKWTRKAVPRTKRAGASDEALAHHAANVFAMAITHRLFEAGWAVESMPGEPIVLVRDEHRFMPGRQLSQLVDGALDAEQWRAGCEQLGILDVVLEPAPPPSAEGGDPDDAEPKRKPKGSRGRRRRADP